MLTRLTTELWTRAEYMLIEPMVEKRNVMTGETFKESINTPYYLSASSETYWSA